MSDAELVHELNTVIQGYVGMSIYQGGGTDSEFRDYALRIAGLAGALTAALQCRPMSDRTQPDIGEAAMWALFGKPLKDRASRVALAP